jgi:hypothetical protein
VVERVGGGVEVTMEVLLAMLFRFETPLRCWLLASLFSSSSLLPLLR